MDSKTLAREIEKNASPGKRRSNPDESDTNVYPAWALLHRQKVLNRAALIMTHAALTTLLCGLTCTGFAAWMLAASASFQRAIQGFPRSRIAGRVVSAVVVFWTARILKAFPLDNWEYLKAYIPVAAVVSFVMLIYFLDELLAARALGGLFQLIGVPVLDAIRFHHPLARGLTLGIYVLVVVGMILIMSPYRFRHFFEWLFARPGRAKGWAVGLGIYGVSLMLIAWMVLG